MSPGAGRAVALALPSESPIKPEDLPSTIHINVKRFQSQKEKRPGDGFQLSISGTFDSLHMDEDGEHFLKGTIQEVIPQAKEEKPPEENNGIIPK